MLDIIQIFVIPKKLNLKYAFNWYIESQMKIYCEIKIE